MYILMGHRPLVGSNCSSIVRNEEGIVHRRQFLRNFSQNSRMRASLSVCCLTARVTLRLYLRNRRLVLNLPTDIVVMIDAWPKRESQKSVSHSPPSRSTPCNSRISRNARSSVLAERCPPVLLLGSDNACSTWPL